MRCRAFADSVHNGRRLPSLHASDVLPQVLDHLEALIACETRDPWRPSDRGGILECLRARLPRFRFELADPGDGELAMLAVRGRPRMVFAVHFDTSPAAVARSADPPQLRIVAARAVGACNGKAAAAGLLAAANAAPGDVALAFSVGTGTGDANSIAALLARERGCSDAIVAGPTRCEAVLAHPGVSSVLLRFQGHASKHALRWRARALELVEAESRARFGGLTGLGFDVGDDPAMADDKSGTRQRFEFRPLPNHDVDALHARFGACAMPGSLLRYEEIFRGPALPAGDIATAEERRLAARDLADELGLPIGNAMDCWTGASLFSQAGLRTLVFGPGDAVDAVEAGVPLAQLQDHAGRIARILAC
jgi:acetylornithine deacetylase